MLLCVPNMCYNVHRSSDPEKAIKNVIVDKPTPETFQVRSSSLIHGTMDDLLKFHKEVRPFCSRC